MKFIVASFITAVSCICTGTLSLVPSPIIAFTIAYNILSSTSQIVIINSNLVSTSDSVNCPVTSCEFKTVGCGSAYTAEHLVFTSPSGGKKAIEADS